ncbi:MAG TPA: hypothetical protein VET25_04290 [Aestuariivirgaceae bacterium]|nr:hypothetical protein [Aestuariivirgaceae bacterium]
MRPTREVLKPEQLPRAFDVLAGENVGRDRRERLVDARAFVKDTIEGQAPKKPAVVEPT